MQPNAFERLTPAEQNTFGLTMLKRAFARLATAEMMLEGLSYETTSRLAEDNAATIIYRTMTEDLHYLLASALDHLDSVRGYWERGEMPPFAPFTLIRAAIESCAYGIWIQHRGTTDSRVMALLTFQWDQRQNVNTYTQAAGSHTPALDIWLLETLNYTKDQRRGLLQRSIKSMPNVTDVLLQTDRLMQSTEPIDGLSAWRICSGVAHGNQQFSAGLMHSKAATLNGQAITQNTISFASLSMVLMPAVEYYETLVALIAEHSKARPGRPDASIMEIKGGPTPPHLH